MNEDKPCCAAEAMRRVKSVEVGGVTIGLVMLDHTFAEVRGLALANEAAVRTELMKCVTCYNYIPASAAAAYTEAVYREYQLWNSKE